MWRRCASVQKCPPSGVSDWRFYARRFGHRCPRRTSEAQHEIREPDHDSRHERRLAGREADYEAWARRAASASARYGATAHTFLTPDPAAPTRRVLIAQFPHAEAAKAW